MTTPAELAKRLRALSGFAALMPEEHAACVEAAAMLEAMGWRPIAMAPRDGTPIVLHLHWCQQTRTGRWNRQHRRWTVDWGKESHSPQIEPAHWMPLPPAPSED